ncbi:hypothetical protein BGZ54_005948 [Gamsiella multidivaricata]|nr:hypothetical protein BGZ54_005948 [Gamsiella multidivaricata]
MDSTPPSLAESNSRHYFYSENNCSSNINTAPGSSAITSSHTAIISAHRPTIGPRASTKAKFFVCDEDSEEELETGSLDQDIDRGTGALQAMPNMEPKCDRGQERVHGDQSEFEDDKKSFPGLAVPHTHHRIYFQHPSIACASGVEGRRQSLLSDLFMAEKLLAAQRAALNKGAQGIAAQKTPSTLSNSSSCCHSTANSDGEASPSKTTLLHQHYRSTREQPHQTISELEHQFLQSNQSQRFGDHLPAQQHDDLVVTKDVTSYDRTPSSPLRRTKKSMFKKLDELAVDTALTEDTSERAAYLSPASLPQFAPPLSIPFPVAPATTASDKAICKTNLVTTLPSASALPPFKCSTKQNNLSTPPSSAVKTCRCTPATPTTTTAFATATSKYTATASSESAASIAAAAANSVGGGGVFSGWSRVYHVQTQVHSLYGQLTSSIQRALSTATAT